MLKIPSMIILGIETSCDETSASLLEVKNKKTKVLSNVISSQVKLHAKFGGVVPHLAAREHVKNIGSVLELAIKDFNPRKIDLIAVTVGPGLISSLLVGTAFARTLAWKLDKPLVGTNHVKGHIYSNWLAPMGTTRTMLPATIFPALCLTVSGGHTQLILMEDYERFTPVGETLDDAAGEAFDKIARILELGYPGGPAIAAESEKPDGARFELSLPRPMLNAKNFDFSFSGLKTAVLYLTRDLTKTHPLKKIRHDMAKEAQQAIVDVLTAKTIRAAKQYGARTVLLAGGVSANKLLRAQLEQRAIAEKIKFLRPEMEYTTDNAAMIAMAGYFEYAKNKKADWESVRVDANLAI